MGSERREEERGGERRQPADRVGRRRLNDASGRIDGMKVCVSSEDDKRRTSVRVVERRTSRRTKSVVGGRRARRERGAKERGKVGRSGQGLRGEE